MRRISLLLFIVLLALSACAAERPPAESNSSTSDLAQEIDVDEGTDEPSASMVVEDVNPDEAAAASLATTLQRVSLNSVDSELPPLDAATTDLFATMTIKPNVQTQIHEPTGTSITMESVELSAAHAPYLFSTVNESTRQAQRQFFVVAMELLQSSTPPQVIHSQTTWTPLVATGDIYTIRLVHELTVDGVAQMQIIDHVHGQTSTRTTVTGTELMAQDQWRIVTLALSELSGIEVDVEHLDGTYFTSSGQLVIPFTDTTGVPAAYLFDAASTTVTLSPFGTAISASLQQNQQASVPFVGLGPAFPDCRVLKCVALTFDDGPGPYTSSLLDILHAHQVKATFFVLGSRVQEHPALTSRLVTDGHEVAGHSFDHADFTKLDAAQITQQIHESDAAMRAAGVPNTGIFRLPYGALHDGVMHMLKQEGLIHVSWSIDPEDWRVKDPNALALFTLPTITASDIVLFHDIKEPSVQAMHIMVPWLKAQGFHFVTVSELIAGRYEPGAIIYRGPPSQAP